MTRLRRDLIGPENGWNDLDNLRLAGNDVKYLSVGKLNKSFGPLLKGSEFDFIQTRSACYREGYEILIYLGTKRLFEAYITVSGEDSIGIVTLKVLEEKFSKARVSTKKKNSMDIFREFRHASEHGDLGKVKKMMKDNIIDPSLVDNCAIKSASQNGHLDVVEELLQDPRVDPSSGDNYSIKLASINGNLTIVKRLLLDKRVDPSASKNWAIGAASGHGHLEVIKELLKDSRVDPSEDSNYAIRLASEKGHLEVVKELLKDPRVKSITDIDMAINYAKLNNHIAVVNELKSWKLKQK